LQQVSAFKGIALHTTLGFLAASISLLCARADYSLAGGLLGPAVGGSLVRRLVPWALVVPPVLGWLRLEGEQAGNFGPEFGTALTVVSTMGIFVVLLIVSARAMEEVDRERLAAKAILQTSEAMLKQTQEVSGVGGWEYDPARGKLQWSEQVYRIHEVPFDFDPASAGQDIGFYRGTDGERIARAFQAACEKGEPYDLELEFTTAKGRHRWIRSLGIPVATNGKVTRVYGYIVDITERKRAQIEIQALNTSLEERIGQRTAELVASNTELEAFAYSVSHDLRAPLRAIDGFATILEEDYAGRVDEEGRDALHRMRAAAQKMAQLIDDMLKLSRLSRAEMSREAVDLSALARSVAGELQASEPARRVSFEVASGLVATGDRALLKVVLDNLVGNAWKFTGKHSGARIEVGMTQKDGVPAYFVRDDGAGFDMAHVDILFSPFQRLHSMAEFTGTGIGLATIKRIIARHGGRVWAEGAVEKGATFYFTLAPELAVARIARERAVPIV